MANHNGSNPMGQDNHGHAKQGNELRHTRSDRKLWIVNGGKRSRTDPSRQRRDPSPQQGNKKDAVLSREQESKAQ
jgi:hypothetical protein